MKGNSFKIAAPFAALLSVITLLHGQVVAADFTHERIRIVGSSTVFPFTTTVAERFGRSTPFRTPVVERTGTGGGISLFCEPSGAHKPDIVNASRPIKKTEVELCARNGVNEIIAMQIGYDGIVIGNSIYGDKYKLTVPQLYLALAAEIPTEKGFQPNPYKKWSDIDDKLPRENIRIYGPPPSSGTRDALEELVMEAGCAAVSPHLSKEIQRKYCIHIREDGYYIEAGENDNLIIQRLVSNPASLGIFGYSFLEQNTDIIQASVINDVEPTIQAISTGDYPVSRSLFVYANKAHMEKVPGIYEFLMEYTSDEAMGEYGYLTDKGLISLMPKLRQQQRETIEEKKVLEKSSHSKIFK